MEFVKQAVVFGFYRQFFGFFLAVAGEAAGVRAQYAAIEFDDAVGDVVEKAAVVGNHHDAAVKLLQQAFQPQNRVDIEVVGRLVEQQNIGLLHPSLRQCHALFLAAA